MTWAVFSEDQRRAIDEMEKSPSERIVAIVGTALLDNTLIRTLKERLRDEKDAAHKLLKVTGPLGNTGPKVDLLWLLGGCEKSYRNAMNGLVQIRNTFAHNLSVGFDSPHEKIVDGFSVLKLHEGRSHYPHHD